MAERIIQQKNRTPSDDTPEPDIAPAAPQVAPMDDILDQIDGILQENTQDFVQAFVQKGGQ
ncbi:MAG: ubiquitin-like protein Pup [Actinomycetaceae bacterium]|nr:ubiquitin-like protein Pup [Actinomycetaceae bacterium]